MHTCRGSCASRRLSQRCNLSALTPSTHLCDDCKPALHCGCHEPCACHSVYMRCVQTPHSACRPMYRRAQLAVHCQHVYTLHNNDTVAHKQRNNAACLGLSQCQRTCCCCLPCRQAAALGRCAGARQCGCRIVPQGQTGVRAGAAVQASSVRSTVAAGALRGLAAATPSSRCARLEAIMALHLWCAAFGTSGLQHSDARCTYTFVNHPQGGQDC